MSGTDSRPAPKPPDPADSVAEYLRRNPDFLVHHPELVAVLRVPHDCGGAVSLIEYQVDALKAQCRDLRERLASLVDNARGNEELAQRLHRLVLALVENHGLDDLFATLYQGLEDGFGADLVALRIFAESARGEDRGLAELVGPVPEAQLFARLLDSGQPRCGRPGADQLVWLFGERAPRVGSAALVPLTIGERRGVLAIASHAEGRFHPSMGTLYLRQLAEVLGRLLAPRVR